MTMAPLLAAQSGVVARSQLVRLGVTDGDLRRMLRRKDLVRLHRGVFLDHTGAPTWLQRAWAACLVLEPAALGPTATLAMNDLLEPVAGDDIELVVPADRRVRPPVGVASVRSVAYEQEVHPSRRPPQMRVEPAVLRVASNARDDAAAIAVLADACRTWRSTAHRLRRTLVDMPPMRRRSFLLEVLADVDAGVHSVLEHRYVEDVERGHGLPTGRRQGRVDLGSAITYRDVDYLGGLVVVELDGGFHASAEARWRDLDRDLAGAVRGSRTIRLGWRQVLDPCRTARSIAQLLAQAGWSGTVRRCPRCKPTSRRLSVT